MTDVVHILTARLAKEAAVAGHVLGLMHRDLPAYSNLPDSQVMRQVFDIAQAHPDLYPLLAELAKEPLPVPTPGSVPEVKDRYGFVFPDESWVDVTEGAWLFGQDAEERARKIAEKVGGYPIRIITRLERLEEGASDG